MLKKDDLLDVLLKDSLITEDQASQVRLEQINTGHDLVSILLDRSFISPKQIALTNAKLLNIPFVDLAQSSFSPQVLSKIPESVARHYVLIPLDLKDEKLRVVMKDPLDLQLLEFLETKTATKITPLLGDTDEILKAITENYSGGVEKEVQAAIKESETEVEKIKKGLTQAQTMQEIVQSAPIARIVSTILEYATKNRASDIHIEPQDSYTRVRYRIDGVLRERLTLPRLVHDGVISRIKILSNLKIDEKRVPQDGRFNVQMEGMDVDLRVSTLPTSHGEKVVLRLLRKEAKVPILSDLGLTGRALKIFEEALKKTRGIILITGPTGCGKTTTLRTALHLINSPGVNIVTLEDPVEYAIPGINQVQINPQAGLTFASGLRSILRQDPNVIMVGEIRDSETMELAIQASLTGHLVFSTLHTGSAAGALPRLLDMGAEPFLLSSTMELVMAQRLIRLLCNDCREKYQADDREVAKLKEVLGSYFPLKEGKIWLYKAKGCAKCAETGYLGREGIYEVLAISQKIATMILERQTSINIERVAVEVGMLTIVRDGFLKVMRGVTTIEEVLRVAQE